MISLTKEEEILFRHALDLSLRASTRAQVECTGFLTLREQEIFMERQGLFESPFEFFGGSEGAERKRCCFKPWGTESLDFVPVSVVKIEPKNRKFAEDLSHRDYLGSLMNLGFEREVFGDLLVQDGVCYLICTPKVSTEVLRNLDRVRHTSVVCSLYEGETTALQPKLKSRNCSVSTLRLDAVLAALFCLSRQKVKELIEEEKVQWNGCTALSPAREVREGDVFSIRGYGKGKLLSVGGKTRKDRLFVEVGVYE